MINYFHEHAWKYLYFQENPPGTIKELCGLLEYEGSFDEIRLFF